MAYARDHSGDERKRVTEVEKDIDKAFEKIIVDRGKLMKNARKRAHKFKRLTPFWEAEFNKIFSKW